MWERVGRRETVESQSLRVFGEDELSLEDRKRVALEAVKYLVAYGFEPAVADECIAGLALELKELDISRQEILEAIQEVKQSDEEVLPTMFSNIITLPDFGKNGNCPEKIAMHKCSRRAAGIQ